MARCFIAWVGKMKKQKLEESGIGYEKKTYAEKSGITIEKEDLEKVLKILQREVVYERYTDEKDINELITLPLKLNKTPISKKTHRVTDQDQNWGWYGYQKEKFIQITKNVLIPVLKKGVNFYNREDKHVLPKLQNKGFNIFFYCTACCEYENIFAPSEIFDTKVDDKNALQPQTETGLFIYDQSGYVVAELIENNLYIHHKIYKCGTQNELKLYEKILNKAVDIITLPPKVLEKRKKESVKNKLKLMRQKYSMLCSKGIENEVTDLENKLSRTKQRIGEVRNELTKAIRKREDIIARIPVMKELRNKNKTKYVLEYDKLIANNKIIDLILGDDCVKVFTDTLLCKHPRTKNLHEIGKMRIEIYTNDDCNQVKIFNLTRQVNGYNKGMHAPHVWENGEPCWGDAEETIAELLARYEYLAIAVVAINFIETVDIEDSAGKYIEEWPIVEYAEPKKKLKEA